MVQVSQSSRCSSRSGSCVLDAACTPGATPVSAAWASRRVPGRDAHRRAQPHAADRRRRRPLRHQLHLALPRAGVAAARAAVALLAAAAVRARVRQRPAACCDWTARCRPRRADGLPLAARSRARAGTRRDDARAGAVLDAVDESTPCDGTLRPGTLQRLERELGLPDAGRFTCRDRRRRSQARCDESRSLPDAPLHWVFDGAQIRLAGRGAPHDPAARSRGAGSRTC